MDVGNCYTFKQQWISVKDRLPKSGQRVLVVVRNRQNVVQTHVTVSEFCRYTDCFGNKRIWWSKYSRRNSEITHWMPLPDAPEV